MRGVEERAYLLGVCEDEMTEDGVVVYALLMRYAVTMLREHSIQRVQQ